MRLTLIRPVIEPDYSGITLLQVRHILPDTLKVHLRCN